MSVWELISTWAELNSPTKHNLTLNSIVFAIIFFTYIPLFLSIYTVNFQLQNLMDIDTLQKTNSSLKTAIDSNLRQFQNLSS